MNEYFGQAEQATGLINQISVQGGLLGTLLALFIIISAILGALLLKEKDKRIEDQRKSQEDLVLPIERLTNTFKDVLDNVRFERRK